MRPPNRINAENTRPGAEFKNLDDAPVVLVLDEIARIYRMGSSTIRRKLAAGTFRPLPFDTRPFRWLKADIERDLSGRAGNPVRRTPRRRRAPVNGAAAAAADRS